MKNGRGRTSQQRQRRRDFLTKTAGGALAATAFAAFPLRLRSAEPVNIGGLYPVTGSMAQIGQGCVNAAKLAVQMVNDAGGIKSLGGAKLNLIVSAPTREDGVLAGTVLTMIDAVRNVHALGISFEDAIGAATTVPARILGRTDVGVLEPGGAADVVVIDDRLDIVHVLCAGRACRGSRLSCASSRRRSRGCSTGRGRVQRSSPPCSAATTFATF